MPLTQPKTDLAYLRNEKAKAEQKLRSCQHREKILERQMSELNRRERVHRLCTRAGMLESFLVCPGELTDDQVMELLKISFRQPEVVLALAKMVHDVHERRTFRTPYEIGRNYTPRRHLLRIGRICAKAQMLIHSAVPPLPHKIIFDAFPGTPLCEIAVLQTAR